jgi:hypothetical protein
MYSRFSRASSSKKDKQVKNRKETGLETVADCIGQNAAVDIHNGMMMN